MIKQIRDDIRFLISLLDYHTIYPSEDDIIEKMVTDSVADRVKQIMERYDLE